MNNLEQRIYYLDGNAVTHLWDKYAQYKQEGQSSDDIRMSPFGNAVLSDYTLDELITIPITDTYLKHAAFLVMFPDLQVFKSVVIVGEEQLKTATYESMLAPSEFVSSLARKRMAALFNKEDAADLQTDIQNKEMSKLIAGFSLNKDAGGDIIYVEQSERISIKDAIIRAIENESLDPKNSALDFYKLCTQLYIATRSRLIDVPAKARKGQKWMLNHQIDFYHLSYLPFVGGFVTGDKYLAEVAQAVIDHLSLDVVVKSPEDFYTEWFRNILSGKS